jgi:alpha-beta hydrolase superfamily lysophospholipase
VGIAAAPDFLEDFTLTTAQQNELAKTGVCYFPSSIGEPYPISIAFIIEAKKHYLLQDKIAINCPVRLLQGLADNDVHWEKSTQIADRLTSNDVVISLVKGGDHRLSSASQLALLGKTVKAFLTAENT